MTVVATIEAVALVVIVWLMLKNQRDNETAWTVERRELLTRIQHPELTPRAAVEPFKLPEFEPDELDLVGTIEEPQEEPLSAP